MSRAIKRIVMPILILAILISSYVLPVSAAIVTRWSHIEFTRIISYSTSGNSIEEPIGYGYALQNPETSEKHFGNNYWKVRVKTGIYQRKTLTINGNSVADSDMGMKLINSGTEKDGTQWVEYDYYISNVANYINPSNTRNTICFTSYNGTLSSVNYLHVLALRPGPAPTAVGYNATAHCITGLNYLMEFSYDGGNSWYAYSSGSNISFNVYPYLSKTSSTYLEVRFKETATAPPSNSWKYTVGKLDPAPTGLYIDWIDNAPALLGLNATKYYAISNTTDFATYTYVDPGYTGVLLDSTLTAGKVIYVRSAANSYAASSAYVALTVPAKATPPVALYDKPSHTLYGLKSTMDFRLEFPDGYSNWMQVPSDNVYFNAYPYTNTSYDLKINVRYRATPAAVQTITVPKLAQAPTGMELEWMDGVGLVLWGLEQGKYYDFNTDAYFDSWYSCDGEYYGINITALGLVPGDSLFIRSAPNTTTYTSACVELIVPPMTAMSASSFAADAPMATSGVTSTQARTEISNEIADMQLDSLVTPEGQAIVLSSDELSVVESDSHVAIEAQTRNATQLSDDELTFGTLKTFTIESSETPVVSSVNASAK